MMPPIIHLVAYTSSTKVNGYVLRTERIIESQRAAGLEVDVISPVDGSGEWRDLEWVMSVFGEKTQHPPASMRFCCGELISAAEIAHRISEHPWVKEGRRPVLHAHTPWYCYMGARVAADKHGLPVVFEIRGLQEESAVIDGKRQIDSLWYEAWKRMGDHARKSADHVFAISPALADDAFDRGARVVTLTPNAVDGEMFRRQTQGERIIARDKHKLGTGPIVAYMGSLRPLEGVEMLVQAMAIVRKSILYARCLIVGAGPSWHDLRALAEDLGLLDAIDMRAQIPPADVPEILGAVDCVAITRPDTMVTRTVTPLKPLEALACGVPVVSSDLPALRYVGRLGTLFAPPGDVEKLADQIVQVLSDRGLNRRLGEDGYQWVRRERTWSRVVETQIAVYRELTHDRA